MGFLFPKAQPAPAPIIIPPAVVEQEAPPVVETPPAVTEAAETVVAETKKKKGAKSTILTGSEGLETTAPTLKKKMGE